MIPCPTKKPRLTFSSAFATGGNVLVHCFMGRSRSATIILAYLIARRGFSLTHALHALRRVRPQAQPNRGFLLELQALDANQTRLHDH